MLSKRRTLWIGSCLFSATIIVAILATLIGRIPTVAEQLPPNTAPISAVLSYPKDGSTWPADTPVPVVVMVNAGVPIKTVEFWTDGRLLYTQTGADKQQSFFKVWSWMPMLEGGHAIFVRAVDANGRTAESNAVHIVASSPAGLIVMKTAQGGETIQSLAGQNGVSAAEIAALNPSIDPAGALDPGTRVFIPEDPFNLPPAGEPVSAPQPNGPVVPAEEGAPVGPVFLLERTFNLNGSTPTAPSLSAAVGVCNVTLTIQDNSDSEEGFFVYALTEASVTFRRITSLKAHTGAGALQYVIPDQRGNVQFYVSSYNSAGESASPPAAANITSPQCQPAAGSPGDLKYKGGFLSMPENVQLAYFYASVNGGGWKRVPTEHTFFEPTSGPIDLRSKVQEILGSGGPGEVDLDVWGWSGGALVHLGQLHINANFATLEICNLPSGCSGDMGSTFWVNEAVVGSDKMEGTRTLRWRAYGADITKAIWQVGSKPFPAEYSIGAPPGLLLSGISEAEVNSQTGIAGGKFEIDFNTYFPPAGNTIQATPNANSSGDSGQSNYILSDLLYIFTNNLMPQNLWSQKLYIRVMPMAGDHPATEPSNSVIVNHQPTGDPPPVHIYAIPTYSVEIVPGSYVNEVQVNQEMGVLGCSIITKVEHDPYVAWYTAIFGKSADDKLAETSYQYWNSRTGETICPNVVELPEDTVLDQIATGLKYFWDTLASTLELVKSELINNLAVIIPGCGSDCKAVLMTGLNLTITYFTGLPPSFPSFDDAVNMGIKYAVQVAITQAGIPYCDDLCQGKIADQIQQAGQEITKTGKTQPGCSAQEYYLWLIKDGKTYHLKPLCFAPGILTKPVTGSMYERGMVQVKVSRIDGGGGVAGMQQLVVDTQAINAAFGDGHSEADYFQITTQENCATVPGQSFQSCASVTHTYNYNMVFNAPLEGIPYPQSTITIPDMLPGQSMVIPVVFEGRVYDYSPPNVYPPRAAAIQAAFPNLDLNKTPVYWWRDFQHLTTSGAQITISARLLCKDKVNPSIWNSPCSEVSTQQFMVP